MSYLILVYCCLLTDRIHLYSSGDCMEKQSDRQYFSCCEASLCVPCSQLDTVM